MSDVIKGIQQLFLRAGLVEGGLSSEFRGPWDPQKTVRLHCVCPSETWMKLLWNRLFSNYYLIIWIMKLFFVDLNRSGQLVGEGCSLKKLLRCLQLGSNRLWDWSNRDFSWKHTGLFSNVSVSSLPEKVNRWWTLLRHWSTQSPSNVFKWIVFKLKDGGNVSRHTAVSQWSPCVVYDAPLQRLFSDLLQAHIYGKQQKATVQDALFAETLERSWRSQNSVDISGSKSRK